MSPERRSAATVSVTGSQPPAVATGAPSDKPPAPGASREAATAQAAAIRGAAAAAVLKRFARKLEGRDPDLRPRGDAALGAAEGRRAPGPAELQTVELQVEALLREARSADNLSRMYEGWTPWL